MGKRVIKVPLSVQGLQQAVRELQDYKMTLHQKMQLFIERLADEGIVTARVVADQDGEDGNPFAHHFNEMVAFEKKVGNNTIRIIGRNADLSRLHTEWYDSEGNRHNDVISPILMLEYGSAGLAVPGHKGTFAKTGNCVDETVWAYATELDENGKPTGWKTATASVPHQPMYSAFVDMEMKINKIAKEVFR